MNIQTGIEVLDKMLEGGIRQGSSALIMSTPGVEDIQFAHQCMYTHLKNKGHVLYIVNNRKPDTVRAQLNAYDWDISEFEKKDQCSFLDCYSGMLFSDIDQGGNNTKAGDIQNTCNKAYDIIRKMGHPALVVIDSLSSLIDVTNQEDEVVRMMQKFMDVMKENKATVVALFTLWPYKRSTIEGLEEIFDCVVKLKAIEQKVILRSYFSVDKASWIKNPPKREVPYKVISPGGVKVFIPKILVTGPFNAGKTSFIHSASASAVSVDRLGTTVALDHGHVEFKGFAVDLFGTPGQERFDPIIKQLGGEALGVIVVVDCTDPKGFARAKDMLELTKTEGLPAVIVANKADLEGALGAEEIRKRLVLPEDIPIVLTIAEDKGEVKDNQPCRLNKEGIEKVLTRLFEMMI